MVRQYRLRLYEGALTIGLPHARHRSTVLLHNDDTAKIAAVALSNDLCSKRFLL